MFQIRTKTVWLNGVVAHGSKPQSAVTVFMVSLALLLVARLEANTLVDPFGECLKRSRMRIKLQSPGECYCLITILDRMSKDGMTCGNMQMP